MPAAAKPVLVFIISWMVACGLAAMLMPALGMSAAAGVIREGEASITSCSRPWYHLGLVHRCDASISWSDETDAPYDLRLQEGPEFHITSLHNLTGTVMVEGHGQLRSRSEQPHPRSPREVIMPAGDPARESIGTYLLLLAGTVALAAGVTAATRPLLLRRKAGTPTADPPA